MQSHPTGAGCRETEAAEDKDEGSNNAMSAPLSLANGLPRTLERGRVSLTTECSISALCFTYLSL